MKNLIPTETVNQIGRLNLSGNVIPANWWHHIKTPTGKPDSTDIVLLSEIIYWYRPTEIRDEFTGESKGLTLSIFFISERYKIVWQEYQTFQFTLKLLYQI